MNTKYISEGYCDTSTIVHKFMYTENEMYNISGGTVIVRFAYNSATYIIGILSVTDTGIEITWDAVGGSLPDTGGRNRRLIITAMNH